jgi:hypothetical protein
MGNAGGVIAVGLVLLVLCFGCIFAGAAGGDWAEGLIDNADNAHFERMREMEMAEAEHNRKEAEAEVDVAEAEVARAREEKEKEEAYARQMEQTVQLEKARGQRAQDEADAYTTKKMADAAYNAIQRQGHLLTLSAAQSTVFAGVFGAAVLFLSLLLFVEVSKRRQKRGTVIVRPTPPGEEYTDAFLRLKEEGPFPFEK